MGRYIDWEDIVARYPSLNSVGGASEVGSAWIGSVESQLDGMLSPQFTAPFSSNNDTIRDLAIELTYIRVGNLKVEEAKDMRDGFMDRLNRLKMGEESMITSSGDVVGMAGDTIWSSSAGDNPVFDMGSPSGWEVDPDLIENIDDAKI